MADINFYPQAVQQAYDQDPRVAMAQALMQRGQSAQPITHWTQGAANLLNQYAGMRNSTKLREQYGQKADQYRQGQSELVKALMGSGASDPQMQQIMGAIQSNPMMAEQALPIAMSNYNARSAAKIKSQDRKEALGDKRRTVDTGAEIITYDGTGAELSRVPKAVAPGTEASLSQQRTTAAEASRHNKAMEGIASQRTAQAGGNLTESEGKAVTYGQRAVSANAILSKLETSGYAPSNMQDRAAARTVGTVAMTPEGQQYDQAKRQFIQAILRRDSGATITPSEMRDNDLTYFPQYGDKPQTIAQKKSAREEAISALRSGSGKGAKMIPGAVNGQAVTVGDMPAGNVIDWSDLQ